MSNKITRVLHQRALARQFRYLLLNQQVQAEEWDQAVDVYLMDVPIDQRDDARKEIQRIFEGSFLTWPQFRMGLVILGLKTELTEQELVLFQVAILNNRLVKI